MAAQADQQQQQPRGILPSETLNALDGRLVDRLNFSSGRLPNSGGSSSNKRIISSKLLYVTTFTFATLKYIQRSPKR